MRISGFLLGLAYLLNFGFTVLYWLILVRAITSWVSPDPRNPIVQFLYRVTEPILAPVRMILPLGNRRGIDLSPLVAFLGIIILRKVIISLLINLANKYS
ncbi:MAG: YggT family protein [Candidatus Omnitrophica bacterium]|nr:YggT family protein [Candidatus Omnitrophota bacterium]MDD5429938.1 YggT family protein [Candidatus Omnitrophota bacterium]